MIRLLDLFGLRAWWRQVQESADRTVEMLETLDLADYAPLEDE